MPLSTRRALVPAFALVAAAGLLSGCTGHGEYTKKHISQANEKMAMLKSGTEWNMAQQQFLAGDLDKSLKTVDRSIALNSNVPKSHVLRGRVLMERGRLEEAREAFLEAEKLNPEFVDAQYYLGIIHERVNQPDEAMTRYKRAMELDKSNPQYLVAASEMLISRGRLDEAESLIQAHQQTFQYNPAVRQIQGHIALLKDDPNGATEKFEQALLLAPGDPMILEDLIQAQVAASRFADAEVNIAKLLDKDGYKERRDLRQLRARCLIGLSRPVEARTILQELTMDKEGGSDLRSWTELGNVAVTLKDKVTLRQVQARLTAMAPDRSEGYVLRALFCKLDGRMENALEAADLAIARAGKDAGPLVLKAMLLQDMNRFGEARQAAQQAVNLDPKSRKANDMLALLSSPNLNGPVMASEPSANP